MATLVVHSDITATTARKVLKGCLDGKVNVTGSGRYPVRDRLPRLRILRAGALGHWDGDPPEAIEDLVAATSGRQDDGADGPAGNSTTVVYTISADATTGQLQLLASLLASLPEVMGTVGRAQEIVIHCGDEVDTLRDALRPYGTFSDERHQAAAA